jgi:signal-transduction protein with cAMP-binding, CBS, and nucleotidyltransferase domain
MEAEYYPPREVVILQNEAPRDVYILVSGAVVSATIFWNTVMILQFIQLWILV